MSTESERIAAGTRTERVEAQKRNGGASERRDSTERREALLHELRGLKLATFADVNQAQVERKQPLIQDFLYPGAYLFVGRPKIGKSWLQLQLALAGAEGTSLLGFRVTAPVEVLCIFAEDDDARIKGRLQALGCATAPSTCHLINQQDFFALAKRFAPSMSFAVFLETWMQEHPRVRLVLLDTEATVRQVWEGESGTSSEGPRVIETDYKQTRVFDEIALRRKVVICLVNHSAKRRGEWQDIHELINRSNTALAGCSGSIVLADPPDADPLEPGKIRILGVRGRDLRDDVMLAVQQEKDLPYFTSLGPYVEVKQTQVEQDILQALEELMREATEGQYIKTAEIAEAIGSSKGAVKRAISRMMKADRTSWKNYRITVKAGKNGGIRLDPKR